jgi:cleavage and polyadenylation specificity factor subunit 5
MSISLSALSGFSFGSKDAVAEEDSSVAQRMARLSLEYKAKGMRTTVEGLLLVHEHEHPHV